MARSNGAQGDTADRTSRRGPSPAGIVTVLGLAMAAVVGAALGTYLLPTLVLLGLAGAALLFAWRPALSVPVTMYVGCTATPAFLPDEFDVGSIKVLIFEPTLLIACTWAAFMLPGSRAASRRIVIYTIAVIGWSVFGLLARGAQLSPILGDVRGLADLGLAAFVAYHVMGTSAATWALQALRASLWTSAPLIVAASAAGLELTGRSEEASLGIGTGTDATRFLTDATFPALAVVCYVAAMYAVGHVQLRSTWSFWAPSLVILFLAFSRNSLLGLIVAVLFAVLCARSQERLSSLVVRGAGVLAVAALLALLGPLALHQIPSDSWVATQLSGYSGRVIGGLGSRTLAVDPSAVFRQQENIRMLRAIGHSPLVGHGFGFAYKPASGAAGSFEATTAQYYGHEFYLWLTMKTGFIGATVLLFVFVDPLVRTLLRPRKDRIGLGAVLAAYLAISTVAPMPSGVPNGMHFGVVLGALMAVTLTRQPHPTGPMDAPRGGPESTSPGT